MRRSMFGPEAYFVNHPSKFLAKQADTKDKTYDAFLMYSANFAFHSKVRRRRSIDARLSSAFDQPAGFCVLSRPQSRRGQSFVLDDMTARCCARRICCRRTAATI